MKNKFSLLALAAAGFAMAFTVSCERGGGGGGEKPDPTEIVVSGTIATDLSRAGADGDALQLVWDEGDRIGLFYSPEGVADAEVVNARFEFDALGSEPGEATFKSAEAHKWHAEAKNHSFTAIYPFNDAHADLTAIEVEIPTEITKHDRLFHEVPMIGEATASQIAGQIDIDFATPLALVSVKVDATRTVMNGEISEVRVVSDKFITGAATYNAETKTLSASAGKDVVFTFAPGEGAIDGVKEFCFAVNPGAGLSEESVLTIEITGDTFSASFDVPLGDTPEADALSVVELDVADAIADGTGTVEIIGEVGTELANSYIVAPGETLILPVKQAFNAWADYFGKPLAADATLSTELLWMDTPGGFSSEAAIAALSMFKPEEGENAGIYVKAGSGEGNATIALKADGETVWSWHLWVTGYDPETENVSIPGTGGVSHILMNRNIGALNTTPGDINSLGLGYQYGRKDPFPSSNNDLSYRVLPYRDIYGADGTLLTIGYYDTDITIEDPIHEDQMEGIEHSVKNPMIYLSAVEHDIPQVRVWTSTDPYLNPGNLKMDMWGSNSSGQDLGKTVFDPCPEGYRVPHDPQIAVELLARQTDSSLLLEKGMDYGDYGYFPFNGYIQGDLESEGLWSETGVWGAVWLNWPGGFGGRMIGYSQSKLTLSAVESSFPAFGMAVRCEK